MDVRSLCVLAPRSIVERLSDHHAVEGRQVVVPLLSFTLSRTVVVSSIIKTSAVKGVPRVGSLRSGTCSLISTWSLCSTFHVSSLGFSY